MAKAKKRRGPSLEDKYLGPEPNYHGYVFKNREEMQSEFHRASNWYNYYNNAKSNAPIVLLYAEKVLGYTKKQIQALKKVENWKLNQGNGNNVRIYFSGFPIAEYSMNILDRINERIAEKGKIIEALKKEIPEDWEKIYKDFRALLKSEQKARTAYRRSVDSSYATIENIFETFSQQKKAENIKEK